MQIVNRLRILQVFFLFSILSAFVLTNEISAKIGCNFYLTTSGVKHNLVEGWKFWHESNVGNGFYKVSISLSNQPSSYAILLISPTGEIYNVKTNQSTQQNSFTFDVGKDLSVGKYKFRIITQYIPEDPDKCESPEFWIGPLPSVNVWISSSKPLTIGEIATVKWDVSGGITNLSYGGWTGNIRLQWYQNGSAKSNLVQTPVSNGSYSFTVPSSINNSSIPGSGFQIAGVNADSGTSIPGGHVYDFSEYFEIKQQITYQWKYGNWDTCTETCGWGTKTRDAFCRDQFGNTVSNYNCSGSPKTSDDCNETYGCKPPVAKINSIDPPSSFVNETISFSGYGNDPDGGSIKSYKWRSSIDGQLSTQSSFTKSNLSIGNHIIYFQVQDDEEEWSIENSINITVKEQIVDEPDEPVELSNDTSFLSEISKDESQLYYIDTPKTATILIVKTENIIGDPIDIYLKKDNKPDINNYHAKSFSGNGNEKIRIDASGADGKEGSNGDVLKEYSLNISEGRYYILVVSANNGGSYTLRAKYLEFDFPFNGVNWYVTRGYNTKDTHVNDKWKYSLDFVQQKCDSYGKPILAAEKGKIVRVRDTGTSDFGRSVTIDHGDGYKTLYAHLSTISVRNNLIIQKGQEIGTCGNTGFSKGEACNHHGGTHLHFSLLKDEGKGRKPEPMSGNSNFIADEIYNGVEINNPSKFIIVDDNGEGWKTYHEGYLGQMRYANGTETELDTIKRMTWIPFIKEEGNYVIYAHIPKKHATANVTYKIHYSGSEKPEEIECNQNDYYNEWVQIGSDTGYHFNAGSSGYIELDTNGIQKDREVGFDAIMFTAPEWGTGGETSVSAPHNIITEFNEIENVVISWNSPSGTSPTAYNIYRNGELLELLNSSITRYVDNETEKNEIYCYFITAFINGIETDPSQYVCANRSKHTCLEEDIDLDDGLVAYYPFNGNANDESGNGNHGTVYGASLIEDRFGNEESAFIFDGVDDYIEKESPNQYLNIGNQSWSFSVWIQSQSTAGHSIVSRYECGWDCGNQGGKGAEALYEIGINKDGFAYFGFRDDNSNNPSIVSDKIVSDNSWHHIAYILDRASSILKIFIDGKINQEISADSMTSVTDSGSPFEIGRVFRQNWASPSSYFNGKIDEIRIYNRALSENDIIKLYGEPDLEDGLIAYYPFNGDTNDKHGNNDLLNEGADFIADQGFNGCYKFERNESDYMYISDSSQSDIDITGNITISVWVKLNQLPVMYNGTLPIATKWEAESERRSFYWEIIGSNGNDLRFVYSDNGEQTDHITGTDTNTNNIIEQKDIGEWVHLVVTANVSTKNISFYKNSIKLSTINHFTDASTIYNGEANFEIGTYGHGSQCFDGLIDEVKVFNRTLSEVEVLKLYEEQKLPDLQNGLVVYYPFNGNADDESGNGNHGTEYGGLTYADGIVDQAGNFDGVDDYVEVTPSSDVSAIDDFAISVWTYVNDWKVQPYNYGYDRQYVFDGHGHSKTDINCFNRPGFGLIYDERSNNEEIHNFIWYEAGSVLEQNTNISIRGEWHHHVFMRIGNIDYTYFDGQQLNSTYGRDVKRNDPLNMQHNWFIGTFSGNNPNCSSIKDGFNYSFFGLLDEMRIYNRALSEAEIKALYNLQQSSTLLSVIPSSQESPSISGSTIFADCHRY